MTPEERAALVARDKASVWHPYTPMEQYRATGSPLVIERASGARLYDADGRSIIDGNASWWTSLLGHNHPRLIKALRKQSEELCHTSLAGITHRPAVEFAESIKQVAPPGLSHVFFSDNGSTSVEAALKLGVQYFAQRKRSTKAAGISQKTHFLSLEGAFHGETLGVTALGGVEAFRAPFSAIVMPVTHLPSPAVDLDLAVSALERELRENAQKICALVVEPLIQGAGGMRIYAPEYLRRARELTAKHDVLLIVDEVFTGYGRTGKFWASDHAEIAPDMLCSAKGLSGGILPFAVTLVRDELEQAFLGDSSRAFYYGHTFCGNPLGAAVAREVLQVYEDEQIVAGTEPRAQLIRESFERMSHQKGVQSARSLGVCGALDLTATSSSPVGSGYLAKAGWEVYERALAKGAYVRPLGNVVYVTPPLNIPLPDLRELLDIVEISVAEVVGES